MTKKPKMDWRAIIAEIHRRGMTLTALAIRAGLPETACRKVVTVKHYPAQAAIADFLGYRPEDLWPDRYPKGGPRILDRTKFPPVATEKRRTAPDNQEAA